MKQYLKTFFEIFCILFTVLVLIQFFRGEELGPAVIRGFIAISLFSGAMTFLLREDETLSKQRILLNQVLYLGSILVVIGVITHLAGWKLSLEVMLVNFVGVLLLFVLIKFLIFSNDRKDADLLNEALKKRKQEQE